MIRELIDTELETVAGGLFDVTSFAHSFNTVIASNSAPQFSQAFGGAGIGGNGGAAASLYRAGAPQNPAPILIGDCPTLHRPPGCPPPPPLPPLGGGVWF